MSAGHTPGPWKIEPRRSDDGCEVSISSDLPDDAPGGWSQFATVVVRMLDDELDEPNGIANAKLIAAAPMLADALEALLAKVDTRDLVIGREPEIDAAAIALRAAGRLP